MSELEPPHDPHRLAHHRRHVREAEAALRRNVSLAGAAVAFSLALGAAGYHLLGGLDWLDAVVNAAMILTGMGPVDRMESAAGKLFAAAYALFSGVFFLSLVALLLPPLFRRGLHRFHLDVAGD